MQYVDIVAATWHAEKSVPYMQIMSWNRFQNQRSSIILPYFLSLPSLRTVFPIQMRTINLSQHSRKFSRAILFLNALDVIRILISKIPLSKNSDYRRAKFLHAL